MRSMVTESPLRTKASCLLLSFTFSQTIKWSRTAEQCHKKKKKKKKKCLSLTVLTTILVILLAILFHFYYYYFFFLVLLLITKGLYISVLRTNFIRKKGHPTTVLSVLDLLNAILGFLECV